jgi:hypothetical protein
LAALVSGGEVDVAAAADAAGVPEADLRAALDHAAPPSRRQEQGEGRGGAFDLM